jgi:hypothetical protein
MGGRFTNGQMPLIVHVHLPWCVSSRNQLAGALCPGSFGACDMNTGIINALNSVFAAAAAAKDMNTCSGLQEAATFIARLGTAYDTTAYNASATAAVNVANTPYNGQIFDTQAAVAKILAVPPWQLGN